MQALSQLSYTPTANHEIIRGRSAWQAGKLDRGERDPLSSRGLARPAAARMPIDPRMPLPAPDSPSPRLRIASSSSPAPPAASAAPLALACATRAPRSSCTAASCASSKRSTTRSSRAAHPSPSILPLDFAKAEAEDFANVASALEAQFGRLDALVHTAVHARHARTDRAPVVRHAGSSVLRVNLAAPMGLTRALMPLLAQRRTRASSFTLDTRGEQPHAYWGSYAAAKAGLDALARDHGGRVGERARTCASTPSFPARSARRCARRRIPARTRDAAAARSARAAVPASDRRPDESRERRAHRRSGLARRRAGLSPPLLAHSAAARAAAGSRPRSSMSGTTGSRATSARRPDARR